MSFSFKLDRIAARADELRALLGESLSGEAYVRASRELSEIEPIVARVEELRQAERAQDEAEARRLMADDPSVRAGVQEADLHPFGTFLARGRRP